MDAWTEPVVHWRVGVDSRAHREALTERGELLATWPPAPFEQCATECFRIGPEFWIWQIGVGGICFQSDDPSVLALPASQGSRQAFDDLVRRSWLPAVYQVWGRQVLHASAVVDAATGGLVASTGPSGAGKSTFAYGLSTRKGWALAADDTLAFSNPQRPPARIALHPLRNDSRLRPAAAAHFGRTGNPSQPVTWPAQPLHVTAIFVLVGSADQDAPQRIDRLKVSESYPLLLAQAHALTLKIPHYNQQLMRDYLALAAAVPVFRLCYRRSFDIVNQTFDDVERHARAIDGGAGNGSGVNWCETQTI